MSAALATVINIEQKRAEYMGNPQLDDGYVRIANELYEAINKFAFSGRQQKVMYAIIRKTYGFSKKSDAISQSQIAEMTGLAKPHVCTTLKELVAMKAIEVDSSGYTHTISINKKYNEWTSYQTGSYQNGNETVTKTVTKPLPIRKLQKTSKDNTKDKDADKKPSAISLSSWIEKLGDKKVIEESDVLYAYTDKVGISEQMVYLCWLQFKDYYLSNTKRYKDWRATFRNAVKGNWYHIWFIGADGKAQITGQGRQVAIANGVTL